MKLRNFLSISIVVLLVTCLIGCNTTNSSNTAGNSVPTPTTDKSDIINYKDDVYHDYKEVGGSVVLVTDVSDFNDHGYNQAAFEGMQVYALAAGVTYSAYSAKENTDAEYLRVLQYAIDNQAEIIICAGPHYAKAVGEMAAKYTDIEFLLLDALPKDSSDEVLPITKNIYCISYNEQEAGYMAGYMAVLDGCKSFGFIGGEEIDPIKRYGYGYLQGINDASYVMQNSAKIHIDYWYADSFMPNDTIKDMAVKWYEDGSDVIFACGGTIYQSVLEAVEPYDGKVIGVDVNQCSISDRFITSAMKDIKASVVAALDSYFANGQSWPAKEEDRSLCYGIKDNSNVLPTDKDSWRFQTVTTDDYDKIYSDIKQGAILISDNIEEVPALNIYVTYYNK